MFIENVSLSDIAKGHHYDAGERGVLIQVVDPDMEFPTPRCPFEKVFQFKFLDIEEEHPLAINQAQADEIAQILLQAFDERRNVIVHCHAGVCRSGAIVEAGVLVGFDDTEKFRVPNTRVKQALMAALMQKADVLERIMIRRTGTAGAIMGAR